MKKFALATLLALSTSVAFAGLMATLHKVASKVVIKVNNLLLNKHYLRKIIL